MAVHVFVCVVVVVVYCNAAIPCIQNLHLVYSEQQAVGIYKNKVNSQSSRRLDFGSSEAG